MGSLLENCKCLPTSDVTPEVALNPDQGSGIKETKTRRNSRVRYRNSAVNAAKAAYYTGHKSWPDMEKLACLRSKISVRLEKCRKFNIGGD